MLHKTLGMTAGAALLLFTGAPIAGAQQSPLVGKWHSTYKIGDLAVDDNLVLSPDGKFEETERANNITSVVSGSYTINPGDILHLAPEKWSPTNLVPPNGKLPAEDMHYQITSPTAWTGNYTDTSQAKPVTITQTFQRVQ